MENFPIDVIISEQMAARAARQQWQCEAFYDVSQHFYDAKQPARAVCLQNQSPTEILRAEMYSEKYKLVSRGRCRRQIDPALPFY